LNGDGGYQIVSQRLHPPVTHKSAKARHSVHA